MTHAQESGTKTGTRNLHGGDTVTRAQETSTSFWWIPVSGSTNLSVCHPHRSKRLVTSCRSRQKRKHQSRHPLQDDDNIKGKGKGPV